MNSYEREAIGDIVIIKWLVFKILSLVKKNLTMLGRMVDLVW